MSLVTAEAREALAATIGCALRSVPGAEAHADLIYAAAERYAEALSKAERDAARRRLIVAAAEFTGRQP